MLAIHPSQQPVHSIIIDDKTSTIRIRLLLHGMVKLHVFNCSNLLGFSKLASQIHIEGAMLLPFVNHMVKIGILKEIPKNLPSLVGSHLKGRQLMS